MTDLDLLNEAYRTWVPFESDVTAALVEAKGRSWHHPSPAYDRFYADIVADMVAHPNEPDTFWLDSAIEYAGFAADKGMATRYLEHLLTHAERLAALGSSLGKAATHLGMIATYPNAVLQTLLGSELRAADPEGQPVLDLLGYRAYGAYISTGTEFSVGLQQADRLKASGQRPTLAGAEQVIAAWRAQQAAVPAPWSIRQQRCAAALTERGE